MVAAPDRGYRRRRPPGTPAAGAGTTGTTDREPWSGRPSPSAVREIAIVGSGPMSRMNDFNTQIIEEFRANEGKVGRQFEGATVLLLTTKSGLTRVNPMMYLAEGERLFVFASKAGAPTNPDRFHNIVADPAVTV